MPTNQRGDPLKSSKFAGAKIPNRNSGLNMQQPSPQGPSGKGRATGNSGSRGTAANFFGGVNSGRNSSEFVNPNGMPINVINNQINITMYNSNLASALASTSNAAA